MMCQVHEDVQSQNEQRHHSGLHPVLLQYSAAVSCYASYYVSLPSCVMPCVMFQVHQDVQPQHEQRHHSGLYPMLLQSYYVSVPSCVMSCVMCQVHQDV